jgi:hypothetical protein
MISAELGDVFAQMETEDPKGRPKCTEVLERVRGIQLELSTEVLFGPLPPEEPTMLKDHSTLSDL